MHLHGKIFFKKLLRNSETFSPQETFWKLRNSTAENLWKFALKGPSSGMLENPYLGTFLETEEATGRSMSLGTCPIQGPFQ